MHIIIAYARSSRAWKPYGSGLVVGKLNRLCVWCLLHSGRDYGNRIYSRSTTVGDELEGTEVQWRQAVSGPVNVSCP